MARTPALTTTLALVALGAGLWLFGSRPDTRGETAPTPTPAADPASLDAPADAGSLMPDARDTPATTDVSRTPSPGPSDQGGRVAEAYLCEPADTDCARISTRASSPEEAEWLARRGYPTPSLMAAYPHLETAWLRERTERGDLAVAALYGRRLMEEGHYLHAVFLLHDTALRGGVYAYYELADIHLGDHERADLRAAGAWLRLAAMAGDHKAYDAFHRVLPDGGMMDMYFIDRRAAEYSRKYLPPRRFEPRPAPPEG